MWDASMGHEMLRALIIPEIGTLDKFDTSATGASYADDRTGLYGQFASYVF